jgi:DNA (cytosine-5)-methyltransferase 1
MKFLSVCSGIEAASVAWNPLGWEAAAFSEIEPFPCQVLKHHYPGVPNLGDMTKFKEWNLEPIDLFCGGTPCQSFSVAGLRKGLDDPRGNLMLTYLAIADKFRPRWLVWENVPGVLSSNGGRDFGSFLGGLGQLGYGFAYRVLDAQYFGVAQRRKRVFVVGYLGDWRPAAAVLFERDSLCVNPAPSREKGKKTSRCLTTGSSQRYDAESETMIPMEVPEVMATLLSSTAGISRTGNAVTEHETYIPMATPIALAENTIGRKPENGGNGDGFTEGGPMYTLNATGVHGVAQPIAWDEELNPSVDVAGTLLRGGAGGRHDGVAQPMLVHGTQDPCVSDSHAFALGRNNGGENVLVAPTLTASNDPSRSPQSSEVTQQVAAVYKASMAVRRLTPVECERLQGFPDHYTDIKPKGKPTPDGPRYKALGNSWAVPVARWIGERIMMVEGLN